MLVDMIVYDYFSLFLKESNLHSLNNLLTKIFETVQWRKSKSAKIICLVRTLVVHTPMIKNLQKIKVIMYTKMSDYLIPQFSTTHTRHTIIKTIKYIKDTTNITITKRHNTMKITNSSLQIIQIGEVYLPKCQCRITTSVKICTNNLSMGVR